MIKNIYSLCKSSQALTIPKTLLQNNNIFCFASKKKEKIVKLKKHVETLEDQLLKKKKDEVQALQNSIVEKNKKTINSMSFDELTMRMKQEKIAVEQLQSNSNKNIDQSIKNDSEKSKKNVSQNKQQSDVNQNGTILKQSELKILIADRQKFLDFDSLEFPWDFEGINKAQKEQNLKSAIEVTKIIDEKTAINIFKQFLTSIEEFDYEQLGENVERKFLRSITKRLQAMQQEQIKIKFENIRTKEITVDLFKVQNIFGVGIEQNRRKNDGASSYVIFDDYIQQEIPAKHIVKKRIEPKELARIYVQLHLNFESDISLTFENSNNGQKKQDKISKKENTKQYHTMVLEKAIVECDYKSIRNKSLSMENSTTELFNASNINDYINVANMKNLASANNFKIIDFDNFMKGNPFISDTIDIE